MLSYFPNEKTLVKEQPGGRPVLPINMAEKDINDM